MADRIRALIDRLAAALNAAAPQGQRAQPWLLIRQNGGIMEISSGGCQCPACVQQLHDAAISYLETVQPLGLDRDDHARLQ